MKIYKLKDNATGLYRRGSSYCCLGKTGKCWSSIGALKNHIRLFDVNYRYLNLKLIEGTTVEEYSESGMISYPLSKLYDTK